MMMMMIIMMMMSSRASCNRPDRLHRRAGDVIPQVLGLATGPLSGRDNSNNNTRSDDGDDGTAAFAFPTACPACGTAVVKEEVGGGVPGFDTLTLNPNGTIGTRLLQTQK